VAGAEGFKSQLKPEAGNKPDQGEYGLLLYFRRPRMLRWFPILWVVKGENSKLHLE
jgi:hypothetical protein